MRRAFTFIGAIAVLFASAATALALGDGGEPHRAEGRRAAEAELGALASRIEALKREVAAGRSAGAELEPLLARAQELASLLDQLDRGDGGAPGRRAVGPDPQDLRERADALRDRADRLASTLADVDRRLAEARRRAELEDRLEAVGGPGDLFADAAPRRGAPAAAAPAQPPAGTTSSPGPSGGGGPGSAPAPAASPAAAASSGVTRSDVAPSGRGSDDLAPAAGDALPTLRRKRAEMAAALSALRAQAEALEAEARAAEKVR